MRRRVASEPQRRRFMRSPVAAAAHGPVFSGRDHGDARERASERVIFRLGTAVDTLISVPTRRRPHNARRE